MMAVDEAVVSRAVVGVIDPELGFHLGGAGMVRTIGVKKDRVNITLSLPVSDWPHLEQLKDLVQHAVVAAAPGAQVNVETVTMDEDERMALRGRLRREMGTDVDPQQGHDHGHGHGHGHGDDGPLPTFLAPEASTRVLVIASGKGGVGKSSVTVNLAVALAKAGKSVGVLDADVYGFSVPKMLGVDHDPVVLGDTVIPAAVHGVRALSMGFFLDDDQPVIWRGPMLHKALQQFLSDAYWGAPDFLLVDLPPGTGDVTLSMAQMMPKAEMFVVTTPQPAAERVAQRAAYAAKKLKLSVRGVIENMSWFTGDDNKRYEIFGAGGGEQLAKSLDVALLGQVPLVPAMREGADNGLPVCLGEPEGEAAHCFNALAEKIISMGPSRIYRKELTVR
jgi:ATP-binding protein involved in chromosome partitioning